MPPPQHEELLAQQAFLQRLARRLTSDDSTADDLVQQTWLAALTRGPRSPEALRSWLATVARNLTARSARDDGRRVARETDVATAEASDGGIEAVDGRLDLQVTLLGHMRRLPETQRRVLALRYSEELSPQQIAARIGVPLNTVKAQLRRGLASLRAEMDRASGGDRSVWALALAPGIGQLHGTATFGAGALIGSVTKMTMNWKVFSAAAILIAALTGVQLTRGDGGDSALSVASTRTQDRSVAMGAPRDLEVDGARVVVHDDSTPKASNADVPAQPAATFRGQVVDVATLDPVIDASIQIEDAEVPTDSNGRFDLGRAIDAKTDRLMVLNPFRDTHIRDAQREIWRLQDDGSWVIPIAIGPMYRLQLAASGVDADDAWLARVVEVSNDGHEHAWGWVPIRGENPSWIRYDNPQEATYPGTPLRLEVLSAEELLRGSTQIAYQITGLHPQVPVIHASEMLSSLRGMVLDGNRTGIEGLDVALAPARSARGKLSASSILQTRTDRTGRFDLLALQPGLYDLSVRDGRGAEVRVENIRAPAGETTLADVIFERPIPVGTIRGELRGENGIRAALRLHATDGRRFTAYDSVNPTRYGFSLQGLEGVGSSKSFHFDDIPAGEYELEVLPIDGRTWTPRTMRVSAPMKGIVFTRDETTQSAFFRVVDEATDEELQDFLLQLHVPPMFTSDSRRHRPGQPVLLSAGQDVRWVIHAPGYAPAHGDRNDFRREGQDLVATVRLSRGWGAKLVLRDHGELLDGGMTGPWAHSLRPGEAPPVVGADVFVDGVKAGTSDASGVVHLGAAHEPDSIEVKVQGWTVFESRRFAQGRVRGDACEVVVWLVRR